MKGLKSNLKLVGRLGTFWRVAGFILIATTIAAAQQNSSGNTRQPAQNESGKSSLDPAQLIINTDLVTLNVTVIDSQGFAVTGLEKKHFTVSDNKVPQEITFFSDADLPLSVGIVFDVSGSMSGKKIQTAQEALATFINTSHPDDEYFLIGLSSQPQLLLDRTRDGNAMVSRLSLVEPKGSTALYDASYLALDRVMQGVYPKRALLIISDGQDNNSRYTFSELRKSLRESGATLYAICIDGGLNGPLDVYGKLVLDELASVSGGRVFFPRNSDQMNRAFEQIALELRHQYAIGYRPANFTADGKRHRIQIKVTTPNKLKRLYVRHREGYYASVATQMRKSQE